MLSFILYPLESSVELVMHGDVGPVASVLGENISKHTEMHLLPFYK